MKLTFFCSSREEEAPGTLPIYSSSHRRRHQLLPSLSSFAIFIRRTYPQQLSIYADAIDMKSEQQEEPISYPKLSIFENPKPADPPGMLTPPLQTSASVPFHWEEIPGKPRPFVCRDESKPKSARSLELPPRLLMEVKVTNSPSPNIVMDAPHMLGCTALSASLSLRTTHSSSKRETKERSFGSRRWGSLRMEEEEISGVCFENRDSAIAEVRITGLKKKKWSFFSLPRRSHLLATIYESLKQAVQWRERQENSTKIG